jgi:hypothetical protein
MIMFILGFLIGFLVGALFIAWAVVFVVTRGKDITRKDGRIVFVERK